MKIASRLGVLLGVVLAFSLSSCGSSGGSCGTVQPCGGDPTGTWKFTSSCESGAGSAFSDAQCPTATATVGGVSTTGTISFNADKTYSVAMTTSGSLTVTLPASCLMVNGVTVSCADLATALMSDPTSPFSAASCSGSSGCTCALTLAASTNNDTGTWSRAGTNLSLVSTGGGPDGGPYCVQGNDLHLISVDTTMPMGPMGTAKITSDIVATKQP